VLALEQRSGVVAADPATHAGVVELRETRRLGRGGRYRGRDLWGSRSP
jgi:hypothetical protein